MRGGAWWVILVAIAVGWGKGGHMGPTTDIARVHTGGSGGQDTWARTRLAALQRVAPDLPEPSARALVAQMAWETGWGAGEWNFNVGNLVASPGAPAFQMNAPGSSATRWQSFRSLDEGVRSFVATVKSYADAWANLLSAPQTDAWVRALAAGPRKYYEDNPAHYAGGVMGCLANVNAILGVSA